jgi:hypothetical protein
VKRKGKPTARELRTLGISTKYAPQRAPGPAKPGGRRGQGNLGHKSGGPTWRG